MRLVAIMNGDNGGGGGGEEELRMQIYMTVYCSLFVICKTDYHINWECAKA